MAAQLKDVADAVHEVIASYTKAASLVQRVESRKTGPEEIAATQELHRSLTLGTMIVQACFDSDSKKYGQAYRVGDFDAKCQLQGALLNLKEVVSSLQAVLLDNEHVDYDSLQHISDECRTNVGVALGTLAQRLSRTQEPAKIYPQSPPAYMSGSVYNDTGLSYSASISTHSSGRTGRTPLTPGPIFDTTRQNLSPLWQGKPMQEPGCEDGHPGRLERKKTDQSLRDSIRDWAGTSPVYGDRDSDDLSVRRPSSHTLGPEDTALLSLTNLSAAALMSDAHDIGTSTHKPLRTTDKAHVPTTASDSEQLRGPSRDRHSPDDYTPIESQGLRGALHAGQTPLGDTRPALASYAHRADQSVRNGNGTFEQKSFATPNVYTTFPTPLRLPSRNASLQPVRQDSKSSQTSSPVMQSPIDAADDRIHYNAPGALPGLGPQVNIYKLRQDQTYPPTHIDGMKVPLPPSSTGRAGSVPLSSQQALPSFQPMPQVMRALADDQSRPQFTANQSPQTRGYPESRWPPPQGPVPPIPFQDPASPSSVPSRMGAQSNGQLSHTRLGPRPERHGQSSTPKSTQPPGPAPQPIRAPSLPVVALSLPEEKNPTPFCKMSVKLFLHPIHLKASASKAFSTAQRPLGMNNMIPYWRCEKCYFEGPMAYQPGAPDKKGRPGKQEKVFDMTVRDSVNAMPGGGGGTRGIHYRWAFLAKCHVPLKQVPEGKRDGSFGSFGCLFCAAEGAARGWLGASTDAMSMLSGQSGGSSSMSCPVFGNLQSFMDHLQIHRQTEYWPGLEMQGRMKCVVGRIAGRDEDFDINFLPIESGDST